VLRSDAYSGAGNCTHILLPGGFGLLRHADLLDHLQDGLAPPLKMFFPLSWKCSLRTLVPSLYSHSMPISLTDLAFLPAPRFLTGLTFGDWLRLLRAHNWEVDAAFWPRATLTTLGTIVTSVLKRIEDSRPSRAIDERSWRRPIFILGLPRSGTTHLYQLLARDPQVCFPTRLDVFNPHTLITLRRLGVHRLLACVPGRRRAMDDIVTHWLSPEEDAIALGLLAGCGDRIDAIFPRHTHSLPTSLTAFRSTLQAFTRKLVEAHGKPVLLKSPSHTECIPEILEAFPEARFVTIFREPTAMLASYLAMLNTGNLLWCTLQWPPAYPPDEILDLLETAVPKYFADRRLIPTGQLVEVRHEDLVADEPGTLSMIYKSLGLPMPEAFLNAPRSDAHRRRGSRHPALMPEVQQRLRQICAAFYAGGWYDEGVAKCGDAAI
jgi:hypothetical protein